MIRPAYALSFFAVLFALLAGLDIAPSHATGPYTALYIFGSSLEDNGNNQNMVQAFGMWPGRRTNGLLYVEQVADSLGLITPVPSSKGGTNYAWSWSSSGFGSSPTYANTTAGEKSTATQVQDYLASLGENGTADPNAIYVINGEFDPLLRLDDGSTDTTDTAENLRRIESATEFANGVLAMAEALSEKGATMFVLHQKPDPAPFLGNTILTEGGIRNFIARILAASAYNKALGDAIGASDLNIKLITSARWIAVAQDRGLILNWSIPSRQNADPDAYFNLASFFSPTASAHRLLAGIVLDLINRIPVVSEPIADLSFLVGDEPWLTSFNKVFEDEDGDDLVFSATSGASAVVRAVVDRSLLTVIPGESGSTTIKLEASDGGAQRGHTTFRVTVTGSSAGVADFDGDQEVGFKDFILFSAHYGTRAGDESYEAMFDLNRDGKVGFADFVLFAQNYGTRELQE